MAIQLVTFGGLRAIDDNGDLDWLLGQHSRAALLIYLAVERRVARESLLALFWPESDAENARHALRQSLYQLRKVVGGDWVESRAHDLVVTSDVRADAHAFTDAIERGDTALAVELYRGPFLDGIHLVDLPSWESWVDSRRAQYARTFRKACRDIIQARQSVGDLRGAIQAAEEWTARDPSDDEAQHRLIQALADAGERTEAIRQYDTYARRLELDGLSPLDETIALAERLRTDATALPALRPAAELAHQPAISDRHETTRGPAPAWRSRRSLAAIAGATLVVAAAWGLLRTPAKPVPAPSESVIAVMPFSVRGAEAVQYLSKGMVTLLGAALDGAGALRPVDTRATFAAIAADSADALGVEPGERIASRLGAGMYVAGDVVEAGGQLQIAAGVYRAGAGCARWKGRSVAPSTGCARGEPSTKAVVNGPADSVFTLVDRLAARLLSGLGDPAADRLLRTAALTTTSLPAFKAYLDGEGLMRTGQFEQAADVYQTAIAGDSTFALAHYRLALAREWAPLPGEDAAASAAARHGARLSTRDRNRLEAFREWRAGDAAQAERAYRAILARYPDDVDAWFQLGEILFHHGPLLGGPVGESEAAWREVLRYEPRNLFALTHLARIAVAGGRISELDSLLRPYPPNALHTDRRLHEMVLLRACARDDTAAARALVNDVRHWEPLAVWRVAAYLTAFSPDAEMTSAIARDLTRDFPSPALRADLHWFASMLDLASGRTGAARRSLADATDAEHSVPAPRRRPAFDAVTEWFAATLPLPYADSTLRRVRQHAMSYPAFSDTRTPAFENEMGMGTPIRLEPLRQYTVGILSSRLRDTASATAAATRLQQLAASGTATDLDRDLDRGLRARLAQQQGRLEDALHLLQTLESQDSQGDIIVIPFVSRANERFLRAELLASLGRDYDALREFSSLGYGSVTEIPLRALSALRQAEIHAHLGHRDQAVAQYARFLEAWRDGDPEFRPLVDAARRQMTEVSRQR